MERVNNGVRALEERPKRVRRNYFVEASRFLAGHFRACCGGRGVYAWHKSKKRFAPGIIRARIKWMRENGYGVAVVNGEVGRE